MFMMKFQCNILNYDQYEVSRASYVLNFSLRAVLHGLQKPQMNAFMWRMHIFSRTYTVPWNSEVPTNILQRKYIYDRVNEYIFYFLSMKYLTVVWIVFFCVFNIQDLLSINFCLCPRCISFYRREILTTIFMSKDELIRNFLASVLDR